MFKLLYIVLILTISLSIKGQKDTLIKRAKISHLLGIEGGYTNRHIIVGNKGDIGLSYIFNYKYLFAKTKISFTPGSNFGVLTKFFVNVGFTTKINKMVSWNLLGGFGLTGGSKIYSFGDPYYPTRYAYGSLTPIIETGLLFNLFESNHFLFEINGSGYVEKMRDIDNDRPFFSLRSFVGNSNTSILYKF